MDIEDVLAESNAKARAGRRAARTMIIGVLATLTVAALLFVAAPNFTGVMATYDKPLRFLPVIGITGIVIGLTWMIRIMRANPEPDSKAWRYRR